MFVRRGVAAPLLLLCFLRTSLSSVVFQSPEAVHASVGDSFTLKCTRDLPMQYCYNSVSWFKVNPRTGKLGEVHTSPEDKLEDDKKSCTRTILNARIQDSGIYYCSSLHDKIVLIGNGTRVVITAPVNPSVVLYTPLEVDAPSVVLQCVVMGAVPSQISVWWVIDEDERKGWTESSWTGQDDAASRYTRAQIAIPADEWREAAHVIECVVKYENMTWSQILHRETQHSDPTCMMWLVLGGCGVPVFTVIVVLTVALCLHKEKQNTRWKITEKTPIITEVEFCCGNPDTVNQLLTR